jgi:hypothetical protein
MTIIQLDPTIPLVTPKGTGYAHFLIDFGQEHHLQWVVFIDDTGECWTFENPQVRIQKNFTMGRTQLSEIKHGPGKVSKNVQPPVE